MKPSPTITVAELHARLSSGEHPYILDVRTPEEYEHERIEGSSALIEYDLLPDSLEQLPSDKSTVIYTFCRSGRRSDIAANYLLSIGYSRVFNVAGGILAWKKNGFTTTGR